MQTTLKFEDLKDGMTVYAYIPWGFSLFNTLEIIGKMGLELSPLEV